MFETSESIKNISLALLKAQDELDLVSENSVNPFFRSKYADLGEHIKTIKPVFSENGLVLTQFPIGEDGNVGVTTIVIHPESGEWMKSTVSVTVDDEKGSSKAQTAGKIISYFRRYMLAAIANVYSGDDNDGNVKKIDKSKIEKLAKDMQGYAGDLTPAAVSQFLGDDCSLSEAIEVISIIKENK